MHVWSLPFFNHQKPLPDHHDLPKRPCNDISWFPQHPWEHGTKSHHQLSDKLQQGALAPAAIPHGLSPRHSPCPFHSLTASCKDAKELTWKEAGSCPHVGHTDLPAQLLSLLFHTHSFSLLTPHLCSLLHLLCPLLSPFYSRSAQAPSSPLRASLSSPLHSAICLLQSKSNKCAATAQLKLFQLLWHPHDMNQNRLALLLTRQLQKRQSIAHQTAGDLKENED